MELILMMWIGSAVLCWVLANSKGRIAGGWFIAGLLLGPLTLIVLALLPASGGERTAAPSPKTHVKCPECRELVIKDACVCRHCRCKLLPQ